MLHINILEFVRIVINIWLVIGLLRDEGARTGGHVISVLADNTSALSWLRHVARVRKPAVNNLAYLRNRNHAIISLVEQHDKNDADQLC
jgi:hypothetical protein